MRKYSALLGLCVILGMSPAANAQSRSRNRYEPGLTRDIRRGVPASNQLFVQDAVKRAQQRHARIESRKWLGQSLMRPTVRSSRSRVYYYDNLLNLPWQGYHPQVWWSTFHWRY